MTSINSSKNHQRRMISPQNLRNISRNHCGRKKSDEEMENSRKVGGWNRVTSPMNISKTIHNSRNCSSNHPPTSSTGIEKNGYYKHKIILKNFENNSNQSFAKGIV